VANENYPESPYPLSEYDVLNMQCGFSNESYKEEMLVEVVSTKLD
jgi:hypothetical protein